MPRDFIVVNHYCEEGFGKGMIPVDIACGFLFAGRLAGILLWYLVAAILAVCGKEPNVSMPVGIGS